MYQLANSATCTSALLPGNGDDLEVTGPCTVAAGTYNYGNVNIYNGGSLTFADAEIDFWAKSILIENSGSLIAGSPQDPIGKNGGSLTIHLYGTDQGIGGSGVSCQTDERCGVPLSIWQTNGSTKVGLPGNINDYFYQYEPLPDDTGNANGYFGYKVLGVSFGGTLQLFGQKGSTLADLPPSESGTSWVRLAQTAPADSSTLQLDTPVDWESGDEIVVTTTDYLPGHSEQLTITAVSANKMTLTVTPNTQHIHNGQAFDLSGVPTRLGLDFTQAETRAAVALLTRDIRIVSEGSSFNQPFPSGPGQYFGGHTVIRQGATPSRSRE